MAVHAWQIEIEDHEIRLTQSMLSHALEAVPCFHHPKMRTFEGRGRAAAAGLVVLDHQTVGRRGCRSRSWIVAGIATPGTGAADTGTSLRSGGWGDGEI